MSRDIRVRVAEVFERGDACAGCPHCHEWYEYHGPGLNEPMAECLVLDGNVEPEQCPGLKPEEPDNAE